MKDLGTRIEEANQLLMAYAVPLEGTLGRAFDEAPDATRFPFQRDRDRIIHSKAFRRLKGKTQVFVAGVGDHFRTRLTHTIEVAQISRDMARTLGLNEDLAECIALAHDLGHTPFGHAGEEALNTWMEQHGSKFEHNRQSYRIVTELIDHSSLYKGLNLNVEVLEGLIKHRTPHDSPFDDVPRRPSLEAQIVNIADEIAYTGHDCDDGLRAGLFSLDELRTVRLIEEVHTVSKERGTNLRGALIHMLIMDLYTETEKQLIDQKITTLDDVYEHATYPVRFSGELRTKLDVLREFLWSNMYMHPEVQINAERGQRIIIELCNHFFAHPSDKVSSLQTINEGSLEEGVKDYVSGMTDKYAEFTFSELLPQQKEI